MREASGPGAAIAPSRGSRVLFIPEVDDVGTSERTPMVLRSLRARHHVVGLRAPWDRLIYDPARSKWPRAFLYAVDKALLAARGLRLARRHRVDTVFCETAHHAIAGLLVARVLGARCVWDSHGHGKRFYESLGKGRASVAMIERLERFLGRNVDALLTVSAADASAYVEMGVPAGKVHVIPLCVRVRAIDAVASVPGAVASRSNGGIPALIFFGSFGYEPNQEALRFVNEVLAPYLEHHGVPCQILIAGRDIPDTPFHRLVRPVGFVANIYAWIRASTVCIVPVRRGVGVLTKVLDAMAVGTPLVLSTFAASGILEIRPGVHGYVAATDEEFLRAVTLALSDPDASREMARRARQLVERTFDWDAYEGLLDSLVGTSIESATGEGIHAHRSHHPQR